MNEDELEEFYAQCPTLYHMAMDNSWPLIEKIGLLNTEKLLDMFGVDEIQKNVLVTKRRPISVPIKNEKLGHAVIRDQIPLLDSDLEVCLADGLEPLDWHKRLNERVFFWTNRRRLITLLSARAYRNSKHDVVELSTRSLVENYLESIELTPMNSGCTRPWRHKRGKSTFLSISEYRYAERRKRSRKDDVVVELTVIGGVPDIKKHVTRVVKMQGADELATIYER